MRARRRSARDLKIDHGIVQLAAAQSLADDRFNRVGVEINLQADRARAAAKTLHMFGKQKGPAVVGRNHFVHAVAELKSPVLDGNLRLFDRPEDSVQICQLRHGQSPLLDPSSRPTDRLCRYGNTNVREGQVVGWIGSGSGAAVAPSRLDL